MTAPGTRSSDWAKPDLSTVRDFEKPGPCSPGSGQPPQWPSSWAIWGRALFGPGHLSPPAEMTIGTCLHPRAAERLKDLCPESQNIKPLSSSQILLPFFSMGSLRTEAQHAGAGIRTGRLLCATRARRPSRPLWAVLHRAGLCAGCRAAPGRPHRAPFSCALAQSSLLGSYVAGRVIEKATTGQQCDLWACLGG